VDTRTERSQAAGTVAVQGSRKAVNRRRGEA